MRQIGFWLLSAAASCTLACTDETSQPPTPPPTHYFVIGADLEEVEANCVEACDAEGMVRASVGNLRRRMESMGLHVNRIAHQSGGEIMLVTSGEDSKQIVLAASSVAGKLDFRLVDDQVEMADLERGIAPPDSEILPTIDGLPPVAVRRIGGISGRHIVEAQADIGPANNWPVVDIAFDAEGGRELARLTTASVGRMIAVVLDGEVISTPIIQEPILGGQVQISGNFTQQSAAALAVALQSEDALPAAFELLVEGTPDQAPPPRK